MAAQEIKELTRLEQTEDLLRFSKSMLNDVQGYKEQMEQFGKTITSNQRMVNKLLSDKQKVVAEINKDKNVVTSQSLLLKERQSLLDGIKEELMKNEDELKELLGRKEEYLKDFQHLEPNLLSQVMGSLEASIQEKMRTVESQKSSLLQHTNLIDNVTKTIDEHNEKIKELYSDLDEFQGYIDDIEDQKQYLLKNYSNSLHEIRNRWKVMDNSVLDEAAGLKNDFEELSETPKKFVGFFPKIALLVKIGWKIANGSILQESDGSYHDISNKKEKDEKNEMNERINEMSEEIRRIYDEIDESFDQENEKADQINDIIEETEKQKESLLEKTGTMKSDFEQWKMNTTFDEKEWEKELHEELGSPEEWRKNQIVDEFEFQKTEKLDAYQKIMDGLQKQHSDKNIDWVKVKEMVQFSLNESGSIKSELLIDKLTNYNRFHELSFESDELLMMDMENEIGSDLISIQSNQNQMIEIDEKFGTNFMEYSETYEKFISVHMSTMRVHHMMEKIESYQYHDTIDHSKYETVLAQITDKINHEVHWMSENPDKFEEPTKKIVNELEKRLLKNQDPLDLVEKFEEITGLKTAQTPSSQGESPKKGQINIGEMDRREAEEALQKIYEKSKTTGLKL